MGKNRRKRNGSAMVLALLFVTFFMIVAAGVVPFAIAQVKHSSTNIDVVEAQYAAEAGAKRAIVGIMQGNTSWAWANNQTHNAIADGTDATKYYYINSITNTANSDKAITDNTKPSTTATYTVSSTGYVNGVTRTVKAIVTPGGGSGGVFSNAAFSKSTLTMQSGTITGDIAAGTVNLQYGTNINGNITYQSPSSNIHGKITGTVKQTSTIGTLDVASMMSASPAMPARPSMPAFSVPSMPLPQYSTTLSGNYYYGSSLSNWSNTYTVSSGQSTFIYVNGDYTIGAPISGGGNITIYATGTINIHRKIEGGTVSIYAGKNIKTSDSGAPISASGNVILQAGGDIDSHAAITGGAVAIYAGQDITASDNNTVIKASSIIMQAGGNINNHSISTADTVQLYAGKAMTCSDSFLTAANITVQSAGDLSVSGGNMTGSETVNIYCGGTSTLTTGIINGAVVTVITGSIKTPKMTNLTGISINVGYPNNITRMYANGNVDIDIVTFGGPSMLVATGTVTINSMNPSMKSSSTIVVADGNINVDSATAGGLYSNGDIYISSAKLTYPDSAVLSKLGVTSGTVTYTIKWSN